MKKILTLVIAFFPLFLFGCGTKATKCEHNYQGELVEPTCTTDGYTIYTCSLCHDSYKTDVVRASGHKLFVTKEGYAATCTEVGLQDELTCSVCHVVTQKQIEIKPLGHEFTQWEEITAPTKLSTGLLRRSCKREGYVEEYILPILDNVNYTYSSKDSTCTAKGYENYSFTVDNQNFYYQLDIEKKDHFYLASDVLPTCTEQGYTSHVCSVCNHTYSDNYVNALGHDPKDYRVEPTCLEDGTLTHGCSRCDFFTSVETLGKLGHNIETNIIAPTCTEKGYTENACTRCDYSEHYDETDSLGHSIQEITVNPTCVIDGYVQEKCNRCDYTKEKTIIQAKGHSYSNFHEQVNATCLEDGTICYYECDNCSGLFNVNKEEVTNLTIPALGHLDDVLFEEIPATCYEAGLTARIGCTRCGAISQTSTVIQALGDHVDNDGNQKCDHCSVPMGDSVIKISTVEELIAVNNNMLMNYELTCDLDVSGSSFAGIGSNENSFLGYFNGNGHTISGLSTTFIFVNNGTINYLSLSSTQTINTPAAGSEPDSLNYGIFTQKNRGKILNCKIVGANKITIYSLYDVTANHGNNVSRVVNYNFGGFSALNDGDIVNCSLTGTFELTIKTETIFRCNKSGMLYMGGIATGNFYVNAGLFAGINRKLIEDCRILGKVVVSHIQTGSNPTGWGQAENFLTTTTGIILGKNEGTLNNVLFTSEPAWVQDLKQTSLKASGATDYVGYKGAFNKNFVAGYENYIGASSGSIEHIYINFD